MAHVAGLAEQIAMSGRLRRTLGIFQYVLLEVDYSR